MSDRIQALKGKITKELNLIHWCERNSFPSLRAYERLARIENELYVRRKLNLERRQSDIAKEADRSCRHRAEELAKLLCIDGSDPELIDSYESDIGCIMAALDVAE